MYFIRTIALTACTRPTPKVLYHRKKNTSSTPQRLSAWFLSPSVSHDTCTNVSWGMGVGARLFVTGRYTWLLVANNSHLDNKKHSCVIRTHLSIVINMYTSSANCINTMNNRYVVCVPITSSGALMQWLVEKLRCSTQAKAVPFIVRIVTYYNVHIYYADK